MPESKSMCDSAWSRALCFKIGFILLKGGADDGSLGRISGCRAIVCIE